jgi:hypothetical protein
VYSTEYPVIAEVPGADGAVHARAICALPAVAVRLVGALGAALTVSVAALLVTAVAPTALTTTRYWSLLSLALVSDVRASVADVAPLTAANVVPPSSLFCH